jgi:hypothetical protein
VVFGHTFFSSLTTLELNEAISNFEFDINNISYFAETALEVLLTCMFRKTTNIDLVRLDLLFTIRRVAFATATDTTNARIANEVWVF